MGYPMTWQRFVNRNGLKEGDYGSLPQNWRRAIPTPERFPVEKLNADVDKIEALHTQMTYLIEDLHRAEGQTAMLVGDLRRLEADATDEGAICKYIAHRTGLSPDVVAVVLKEFIAW